LVTFTRIALKIPRPVTAVPVRFRPRAPIIRMGYTTTGNSVSADSGSLVSVVVSVEPTRSSTRRSLMAKSAMGILHRSNDALVAHQLLHSSQIHSSHNEPARKSVPEPMPCEVRDLGLYTNIGKNHSSGGAAQHFNPVINGLIASIYVLGAAPSAGKTTLAKQISDQVDLRLGARQAVKRRVAARWKILDRCYDWSSQWAPAGEAEAGSAGAPPAKQ